MPSYNIKWWMIKLILKKFARELAYSCKITRNVLIPTVWSLKMHGTCQTISSDGSQIREHEMRLVSLANKSSSFNRSIFLDLFIFGIKIYLEFNSSLDDAYLKRLDNHPSKLCGDKESTLLWHYQHVAIGWVETCLTHILIASVRMDTKTVFHWRVSGTTHGFYTLNKVNFVRIFWVPNWFPSELRGVHMKSWITIGGKVADKVLLMSSLFGGFKYRFLTSRW